MNSDLFGFGERPVLAGRRTVARILFAAPIDGSYELWRTRLEDGRVERLTSGRHMLAWHCTVRGPRWRVACGGHPRLGHGAAGRRQLRGAAAARRAPAQARDRRPPCAA